MRRSSSQNRSGSGSAQQAQQTGSNALDMRNRTSSRRSSFLRAFGSSASSTKSLGSVGGAASQNAVVPESARFASTMTLAELRTMNDTQFRSPGEGNSSSSSEEDAFDGEEKELRTYRGQRGAADAMSRRHTRKRSSSFAKQLERRDGERLRASSFLMQDGQASPISPKSGDVGKAMARATAGSALERFRLAIRRVITQRRRGAEFTVLTHAVLDNDARLIKWLITEAKANVDERDAKGRTAAMHGARAGAVREIMYLYEEYGADVSLEDNDGKTALILAAECGALDACRYLVHTAGADVEHPDLEGYTALMRVAVHDHYIDMVRWFVRRAEANVEARNNQGDTVLIVAARAGLIRTVRWLVEFGGASLDSVNNQNHPAWRLAALSGAMPVFAWLFAHGRVDIDAQDKVGKTVLHNAAENGQLALCKEVVEKYGADVDATMQNGRTSLMLACVNGHMRVVEYLIEEAGADVAHEDFDTRDAAMLATEAAQWDIVSFLTERAEDANVDPNKPDWNIVMHQALKNKEGVVEHLRRSDSKFDLHTVDKEGRSFLMHAALNGRLEQVKELIMSGGLDARAKQTGGRNAGMDSLHLARSKRWFSVYMYLFVHLYVHRDSSGADVFVARHLTVLRAINKNDIHQLYDFCREELLRTEKPVLLALKFAWLLHQIGKHDPIHKVLYEQMSNRFLKAAMDKFESVPSIQLQGWVLEERDRLGQRVITVALDAGAACVEFITLPEVSRIMSSWWNRVDGPIYHWTQMPYYWFLGSSVKQWLTRFSFILFLLFFCLAVTRYRKLDESIDMMEGILVTFVVGRLAQFLFHQELSWDSMRRVSQDMYSMMHFFVCLAISGVAILRMIRQRSDIIDLMYFSLICLASLTIWLLSLEMFTTNKSVGPLLISIRKMTYDVRNFALIFVIVILGFFFGYAFVLREGKNDGSGALDTWDSTSNQLINLYVTAATGEIDFGNFADADITRQRVLESLSIVLMLVAGIVLVNLLIAMMGSTYEDVRGIAREQYLYRLALHRWNVDRSTVMLPVPFNLLLVIPYFLFLVADYVKCGWSRNMEKNFFRGYCHHCHTAWSSEHFNINRPTSGRKHRYDEVTYREFTPGEAAKRLCNYCLRARSVRTFRSYVLERMSMALLFVLLWLPALGLYYAFYHPARTIWTKVRLRKFVGQRGDAGRRKYSQRHKEATHSHRVMDTKRLLEDTRKYSFFVPVIGLLDDPLECFSADGNNDEDKRGGEDFAEGIQHGGDMGRQKSSDSSTSGVPRQRSTSSRSPSGDSTIQRGKRRLHVRRRSVIARQKSLHRQKSLQQQRAIGGGQGGDVHFGDDDDGTVSSNIIQFDGNCMENVTRAAVSRSQLDLPKMESAGSKMLRKFEEGSKFQRKRRFGNQRMKTKAQLISETKSAFD